MLYGVLDYQENITNIKYDNVTTMSLEMKAGVGIFESDITQEI